MAKIKKKIKPQIKEVVILESMDKFALDHYGRYGRSVLEDRAIPDFRDGQNPVNRRVLWSAYQLGINSKAKFVKAARIVGDVLGRYHPHGDVSCYKAMVGMTNVGHVVNNICIGLIEGEGNWGNLSNRGPAAMRYTEARLSKFADEVLFNKFYMPVITTVPNFDSSTVEPLVLPALLPLVFLNGRFGIAPGATTNIPAFNGNTLIDLLAKAYKGEEVGSKLLSQTLTVVSTFGGAEEGNMKDPGRKDLFSKKKGSVVILPAYKVDQKHNRIVFDRFATESLPAAIERLENLAGVRSVEDQSDTKDRYGKLVVNLKRQPEPEFKKAIAKIVDQLSVKENYVLNFTKRFKDETGQASATMKAMTLPEAFAEWIKWRVKLEQRACTYWIKQDDKELHRLGLLIQAVDLIDFIVKLLKDKKLKTNDEVYQQYAKKAKVELGDAKYVLSRPIITLRNLEKLQLENQVKEVMKNKKALESRKDKPMPFLLEQVTGFRTFFKV